MQTRAKTHTREHNAVYAHKAACTTNERINAPSQHISPQTKLISNKIKWTSVYQRKVKAVFKTRHARCNRRAPACTTVRATRQALPDLLEQGCKGVAGHVTEMFYEVQAVLVYQFALSVRELQTRPGCLLQLRLGASCSFCNKKRRTMLRLVFGKALC